MRKRRREQDEAEDAEWEAARKRRRQEGQEADELDDGLGSRNSPRRPRLQNLFSARNPVGKSDEACSNDQADKSDEGIETASDNSLDDAIDVDALVNESDSLGEWAASPRRARG